MTYEKKNFVLNFFDEWAENLSELPFVRVLGTAFLFDFLDGLPQKRYPDDWANLLQNDLEGFNGLERYYGGDLSMQNCMLEPYYAESEADDDVKSRTGTVYYNLWKNFSKREYYGQAKDLLQERLEKNGISDLNFCKALDAGCGGGRYSMALKELGCEHVTGLDVSHKSVSFARSMSPFSEDEVCFQQGSVLSLPFEDCSFDFVFSNGVLHHTTNPGKGLSEIYRVLKPGGHAWLYLYGGKGSFFWNVVDVCRRVLKGIPQAYTQDVMRVLSYSPGRIFHRCDFWYVPIQERYLVADVESMLRKTGFSRWQRLMRGCANDWDEIIYNNPHIDNYIYGEGEARFWLKK